MKCVICGKEIEKSMYRNEILCSSECFGKHFWMERLSDPEAIIINKKCYYIGNENSRSSFRGFGGAKFIIQKNTGEVITTTNLWHNGDIPDEFYKGDNAKFLK